MGNIGPYFLLFLLPVYVFLTVVYMRKSHLCDRSLLHDISLSLYIYISNPQNFMHMLK